jgi:rare lipoprotein A
MEETMRTIPTFVASTLIATMAAVGCSPDAEPEREPVAEMPPVAAERPVEQVPEAVLAQLKEQYPVLREEPAPPPQPNGDASPDQVPERVQNALPPRVLERVTGPATFYADKFEGRRTASGIPFRQNQMVAAHRAYPFGTVLRVTNPRNDRAVTVRVVDRGPFARPRGAERPVLDLSRRAAQQIGIIEAGRAPVRIEVLEWGQGIAT